MRDPGLDTRGIKLPSPPLIPKSTLHWRRSSGSFIPNQSSLSLLLCFVVKGTLQLQHSSFWLPHVIQSGMIRKHFPFIPFVFRFHFQTKSSSLKAQSNSRFRKKSCLVLSPKCHNHYSVYQHDTQIFIAKPRRISTCLVFKVSRVFISSLGQRFEIVSFPPVCSSQNFSSIR
jgi:hypothetical protein